jgi:hypothetical protein
MTARPLSEWHEDDGAVLWWAFPIVEPPYVGTPNDSDWPFDEIAFYDLGWTKLDVPISLNAK